MIANLCYLGVNLMLFLFKSFSQSSVRRTLSAIGLTGCLLTALPTIGLSQSTPGFTLFGGTRSENQLGYYLDFGGRSNGWDRYRLRIPAKKMRLAVAQFSISYPDYYDGQFDTKDIEVVVKGKSVPLQEVKWNAENHVIEIYPQEPVPANSSVELVFSNVKNPGFGGMFYFNCNILTPGDVPLLRYVGTWILSIS
ncbi:MAG: DUF2808 domain-containing protein [Leptolyngbyaceae bacterium]|nr:DUF2808 domain-containing protein [Leptolyngbyaceae bacterium]